MGHDRHAQRRFPRAARDRQALFRPRRVDRRSPGSQDPSRVGLLGCGHVDAADRSASREVVAVTASIERLEKSPADTLGALIAESERFGLSFVRKLAEEWTSGTNRFDGPGELLIVARRANELVGVCGLNVDPY